MTMAIVPSTMNFVSSYYCFKLFKYNKQWRNTHPGYYGPRATGGPQALKGPLGNFKDLQKLTRF